MKVIDIKASSSFRGIDTQTSFGVDKCVIGGLSITDLDNELMSKNHLTTRYANDIRQVASPSSLRKVREIRIWDPNKKFVLKVGNFILRTSPQQCISLELFVKDSNYENLFPVNIATINNNLQEALDFFREICGITISKDAAVFRNIEISLDIVLDRKYNDYTNAIKYLYENVAGNYTDKNSFKKIDEGFKVHNTARSLKFYNKSLQLKKDHNIEILPDILRIEYTLKKGKLKSIAGLSSLAISDKKLKETFFYLFKKDVLNTHKKRQTLLESKLMVLGKSVITNRYWIKDFVISVQSLITHDSFLLDKKTVLKVMKKLKNTNYIKNYKKFITLIDSKYLENTELLKELIEKILSSEADS